MSLLPEPIFNYRTGLEALEAAMRAIQPPGHTLRALTIRVSERIDRDDHSFLQALRPIAREYGFTAHRAKYDHGERYSVVWVFNTR